MGQVVRSKNLPRLSNLKWNIPLSWEPYFLIKVDPVGKFPLLGAYSVLGPGMAQKERTSGQAICLPHLTPILVP